MIVYGQLLDDVCSDFEWDFLCYFSVGFFLYDLVDCGFLVNILVEYFMVLEFVCVVGKCLGIENFGQYLILVMLCCLLNKCYGIIYIDSCLKVVIVLFYFNVWWLDISDGCLWFLYCIDNIDDVVVFEFKLLFGEFVVFKCCENLFYGYLFYEGEWWVIQVVWLISEEEKLCKIKCGKFLCVFKKLFGKFDICFGVGCVCDVFYWD